jgi:hypothetical protein
MGRFWKLLERNGRFRNQIQTSKRFELFKDLLLAMLMGKNIKSRKIGFIA